MKAAGMEATGVIKATDLEEAPGMDPAALVRLEQLTDEAREHIEQSKAPNTRRAYRSDRADFSDWCRHHGRAPLPESPETLALYLTDCARGLKSSTVQRRMASITQDHAAAGYGESPVRHALDPHRFRYACFGTGNPQTAVRCGRLEPQSAY